MRKSSLLLGCALAAGIAGNAAAQDFTYKGSLTSDLRMTVPGQDMPSDVESVRFDRSDNTFRLTGEFRSSNVNVVVDGSLTYSGKSDVNKLNTLQYRTHVDPFYFESEAMYIQIKDFIMNGVDLKVGRQIVEWGSADRFNPTSVLNSLDLEDPQDFGRRIANEMINLTFAPDWEVEGEETPIFSEFQFQIVWVPRFRSAMVPYSSEYAFGGPDQFRRFAKSKTLNNLIDLQELFVKYNGSILYNVNVQEPDDSIQNSQVGMHLSFSLLGVDLGFMAYYGFDHNVQPRDINVTASATDINVQDAIETEIHNVYGDDQTRANLMTLMDNFGRSDKIKTITADTDVTVVYPRVWVVGADFSTSLDFMGGVGLWGEMAVFIHDDVPMYININGNPMKDYNVKKGAFVKAVVGLDNTFTSWLYVNTQYIYGFVDEFGANDVGHYWMINADFKAFNELMLFRLSVVMQLTDPSAIIMPSFSFKFWPGTEMILGALIHAGSDDSTFGNRTVGPNYLFFQARYSF